MADITVKVGVKLDVSKHDAEACLRIVEMWLNACDGRALVQCERHDGNVQYELTERGKYEASYLDKKVAEYWKMKEQGSDAEHGA